MSEEGASLADSAFDAVRRDIIHGRLGPDERLRLERLREVYGIGPTPMREALQRLRAEGMVVAEGNRGFAVAPLDLAEFADLNAARIDVELAALRRSVSKGDDDWEAGMAAAAWRMAKADRLLAEGATALVQWEEANSAFHAAAVAACGSRWLLWVRELLHAQCARFRLASVGRSAPSRDFGAEHAAIAESALARDAEAACRLTAEHYARTATELGVTPVA